MKSNLMTTTAALLIGLSGAAYAQQTTAGTTAVPSRVQSEVGRDMPASGTASETRMRSFSSSTTTEPFTGSVASGMSAGELIGKNVVDSEGESVGKVSDLIIDADGKVQQAIVTYGGFLGFGAKTSAVDLDEVTLDGTDGDVVLAISRAEVDALPDYERDDDGWFSSDARRADMTRTQAGVDTDRSTPQAGTAMRGERRAADTSQERMRSFRSSTTAEPFTGSVAGGMSADELIGKNVVDSEGESVGKVADLIIDADGTVRHAVVTYGGFLGFGAKTTAVDLEDVTLDTSNDDIVLGITRAAVDDLPDYTRNDDGWARD